MARWESKINLADMAIITKKKPDGLAGAAREAFTDRLARGRSRGRGRGRGSGSGRGRGRSPRVNPNPNPNPNPYSDTFTMDFKPEAQLTPQQKALTANPNPNP